MQSNLGSSPLRIDFDEAEEGGWVQRTEDVHLSSEERHGVEKLRELYNELLGELHYVRM